MFSNKKVQWALWGLVFCVGFVFFLYLTFPYGVLKELLSAQVQKQTGYAIRMQNLKPALIVGIKGDKIVMQKLGASKSFEFDHARINLVLWRTLIGKASIRIKLSGKKLGSLTVQTDTPLLSLLLGKASSGGVQVWAEKFRVDDISAFALDSMANSRGVSPVVQPLLQQLGIDGQITGEVSLHMKNGDASTADGIVDLTLQNSKLSFDPEMGIPDQQVRKGLIAAKIKKGSVKIDSKTIIDATDLNLKPAGGIKLEKRTADSQLNLTIDLGLGGALLDSIGYFLPGLGGEEVSPGKYRFVVSKRLGS